MDETAAKEANHKVWLWTAVTKRFTLFHIAQTRAADVAKKLLGKDFSGIVTSDRYGGFDWIDKQQLCWTHLLRDFQSLIDAGGKAKTNRVDHLWTFLNHEDVEPTNNANERSLRHAVI